VGKLDALGKLLEKDGREQEAEAGVNYVTGRTLGGRKTGWGGPPRRHPRG